MRSDFDIHAQYARWSTRVPWWLFWADRWLKAAFVAGATWGLRPTELLPWPPTMEERVSAVEAKFGKQTTPITDAGERDD